jgi:adenylylsulfate kinase-like enzyme
LSDQVAPARTELLLIGGRSGVGKSTVAAELHRLLRERQVWHGHVEGDNLDMAYPTPWEHGLAERNLAGMWPNYRAFGHTRLLYVNTAAVVVADLVTALGGDVRRVGVPALAPGERRPPDPARCGRMGA